MRGLELGAQSARPRTRARTRDESGRECRWHIDLSTNARVGARAPCRSRARDTRSGVGIWLSSLEFGLVAGRPTRRDHDLDEQFPSVE